MWKVSDLMTVASVSSQLLLPLGCWHQHVISSLAPNPAMGMPGSFAILIHRVVSSIVGQVLVRYWVMLMLGIRVREDTKLHDPHTAFSLTMSKTLQIRS